MCLERMDVAWFFGNILILLNVELLWRIKYGLALKLRIALCIVCVLRNSEDFSYVSLYLVGKCDYTIS